MFHTRDLCEVAFVGEYSQPKYYSIEHNKVSLDELVQLTEELEASADNDYRDRRDATELEKVS